MSTQSAKHRKAYQAIHEANNALRVRISDILEALPMLEERRCIIDKEAQSLVLRCDRYFDNDLRRSNPASSLQTERELARFVKLASSLKAHIELMHHTSISMMEDQPPTNPFAVFASNNPEQRGLSPLTVVDDLATLSSAANRSIEDLRSRGSVKLTGAPKKRRAAAITEQAAATFERLSGRKATQTIDPISGEARGAFLDFLRSVFKEFRVRASAEAQIKALMKKRVPK